MRAARILAALLCLLLLVSCAQGQVSGDNGEKGGLPEAGLPSTGKLPLSYATQFAVEHLEGGAELVTIGGKERFLLLPQGVEAPAGLPEDVRVLRGPFENIYLAASSAMDFFRALNELDRVRFTSTTQENWAGMPEVLEKLNAGSMYYVGKYSAPDYEALLEGDTDIAIESTMIGHSPKVRESIEGLDIPVLVERSSYEPHPLGRLEWIKLYGLLTGKLEEAEAFFDRELEKLSGILDEAADADGPTAAYFSLNAAGSVTVRKPGDYIARTLELAGGRYIFSDLPGADENDLSTLNMQAEAFYAGAKDAELLIYNSTIEKELFTLDELLEKGDWLADFRAVREGRVWCTSKDMFQQVTGLTDILLDFHSIIEDPDVDDAQLRYLHRLR